MANPDTTNIDRLATPENTGLQNSETVTKSGGIQTPPQVPNGRHIANAEAVSGQGAPEPGFLTANGSLDSHAVILASGGRNSSPAAGTPYDRITWPDIVRLAAAPEARPKERARLVILSTYAESDGRTHQVQRDRGVFGGLAVDIDTGSPQLLDVVAAFKAVAGDVEAVVYSSSSATTDERKWRVLVPLANPIAGADYADTQTALFELLEARGLKCDAALARSAQPVYLPNVPPKRRDANGKPAFYQWHHIKGARLDLAAGHAIVVARDNLRAQRAAVVEAEAKRAAEYRNKRLSYVEATGDDFEPIAHFNAHHTVADMLARYGFEQSPRGGGHYKSPLSEKGSYATQDRGDHWVCLSEWARTLNAGRQTKNGKAFAGDAFDLFVAFEHGGDRRAAVRAYAAEVRPAAAAATVRLLETTVSTKNPPPPPARLEKIDPPPVVELPELRGTLRHQLQGMAIAKPRVVVVTSGTSVGKSFAAAELLSKSFDRVVFNVESHAAANAMVERLKAAGHTDAVAFPPLNENNPCPGWTAEDAKRIAGEHGFPYPAVAMERALAVGVPMLACSRCPLSGLARRPVVPTADPALAAFAPAGDAVTMAEFSDPWAAAEPADNIDPTEGEECLCPYWRQRREWQKSQHPVQCHERTRRNPALIKPYLGETVAVVTDEQATNNTTPHEVIAGHELRAVAEAVRAAADNERNRAAKMRFSKGREESHLVAAWADTVATVADGMADHLDAVAAAGAPGITPFPSFVAGTVTRPKRPNQKLAELLAKTELPKAFSRPAFELVRRVAMGDVGNMGAGYLPGENVKVFCSVDGGGEHYAHIHRSWRMVFNPGVSHFILDAHADVVGIRNAFPDAVVLAPQGEAPRVHDARQWWKEITPASHPSVVVDCIEQALDWSGWQRVALLLTKRHRNVLFPQTRPRGGRPPEDKPVDVEAIANWNAGRRAISGNTMPQRVEAARAIAARVEAIRARLARDEHGNAFVEHLRGTKSRGSNKFIDGTDGVLVVGQTRCNPGKIVAHLLATGRGQAVADCPTGDWVTRGVEGQLPTVDGGTKTVRWSGYKHPEWAEAARFVNRADLEQTADRARTRLDTGKPVLLVAAEPAGLPLAEPPPRLPAGVARVLDAVRTLTGGPKVVPPCEDGQTHAGGESGQRCIGTTPDEVGSMRRRCIEHSVSPILLHGLRIETGFPLDEIAGAVDAPRRTVQAWLADAVARGVLERTGTGRWTRYAVPVPGQVENHPRPLVLEPATVSEPGNDLERANAMLDEAATIDEPGDGIPEPAPRRPSRATPNAPNAPTAPRKRWLPMRTPGEPRAPQPAVLAALAAERDRIRANPDWNAPETWAAVRDAIPPNDARAEMERVEAALPPRFRAVQRE